MPLASLPYIILVPTYREAIGIFGNHPLECRNGFEGIEIDHQNFIYLTGMGKTNTAITVTRLLTVIEQEINLILMGVAGAYRSSQFNLGDIAVIQEDTFVDEAVWTGEAIKGIPVINDNKVQFPLTHINLPVCNANTVSLVSGTDELAELYSSITDASLESMEGAAFGQAASHFNRSYMQIRAVSNYCGANPQWNVKKALASLALFYNQFTGSKLSLF